MNKVNIGKVQSPPNVQKSDILSITLPMINPMKIEDKSEQTITSYVRAVERLVRFHDLVHPRDLDIDEVYDFLVSLNEKSKKKNLALIRKSLKVSQPIPKPRLTIRQFILLTTGKEPYQCPCCNKGEMVIVSILPAIRGSPTSSMYILNGKQFRTILLFILFTIFVKKLHRY